MGTPHKYIGDRKALVAGLVDVFFKATIGASGAPTLVTAGGASRGVTSLTIATPGVYTLTFDEKFRALMDLNLMFLKATGVPLGTNFIIVSYTASTGVLVFTTLGVTATADTTAIPVDPTNGATMQGHLVMARGSSN